MRQLFREPCLRVVWGRLGHRRLRERSESFPNPEALGRRRELVTRWQASTEAIVTYLRARGGGSLDLVDASTLAADVDVCAA